ncbi:hypothetical protein [Taklimakanibacter deserti]|uniref:hypothetical protein n=1 Tax=Taklimakanibacter deserti TaxID=2267839 RepID=UPI000E65D370
MRLLTRQISILLFLGAAPMAAHGAEPLSKSDSSTVKIERIGTLGLEKAQKGDGAIAIFTPLEAKVITCSGSCGGQPVGSWTCPADQSCSLDCTTNPPTRSCYTP